LLQRQILHSKFSVILIRQKVNILHYVIQKKAKNLKVYNIMEKPIEDSQTAKATEESEETEVLKQKWEKTSIIPWGVTGLIVIATVAVIFFAGTRKAEEPVRSERKLTNVEVLTVNTEEFIESLTLPAVINADRVAGIRPEFRGTLERWFSPEGAQVKLDEVIAEINTESLRLNLEELEAAMKTASQNVSLSNIRRESAQVNLDNIKKNTKIQEIALASAESSYKLAKRQFDRVEILVKQKEIALASAESNYKLAKKKFDRVKQLKKQEMASAAALDDAQNALTQSELAVVSAKQDLDEASVSALDKAQNSLTQSELAVIRAKQNLNNVLLNIRSAELAIKEAKAGIELAEARIVELEASINLLEHKIEKGKLRAPFSGRLEEHLVQPGEMVSPNAPIVIIYDLHYLRATINVPDRYVGFLDPENEGAKTFIRMNMPGAEQRIRSSLIIPGLPTLTGGTGSGIELDADIARIAQSSDPRSNTFKVELRFPNPGNALKHGIIARSKIEYLVYPDAVIIPVKAVQVSDVGPRVLVVDNINGAQVVSVRDIKPVSIHGSKVFIRGGLKQGDRLIVAGWKGLVGGEKVNVLVEDGNFIKPKIKKTKY